MNTSKSALHSLGRYGFITVHNEMTYWPEICYTGKYFINESQKKTMELTTPPMKIPLPLHMYMENKLNSLFRDGLKIIR